MLDDITLDVIDRIKTEKLKVVGKPTVNCYLAVRAILLRSRDEWEWIDKVRKVKLFKEGPGRERSITTEQADRSAAKRNCSSFLRRQLGKHSEKVFTFAGKPLGWAHTRAWRNALKPLRGSRNFR